MSPDELESVLEMSCEERYDIFLSMVGDERDIWILINEENRFLKIFSDDEKIDYLPVWPSADFAKNYAQGSPELSPKVLSLPEFFKKWIPGLKKDGIDIGVLPGKDGTVWITEPAELEKDIQEELSNSAF